MAAPDYLSRLKAKLRQRKLLPRSASESVSILCAVAAATPSCLF
jgi:hypothetical protein